MTDWRGKDCSRKCDYREFKIVNYGRLERLDAYTDGLGPWRLKDAKSFTLRSDNKTEDGEVMCETRL